jgi:predicted Zn-dependent protease
MEGIARTTIVILRAGEQVSESLVDAVGDVIARELDIPVCTVLRPIQLPPHTRIRGVVDGRQWAVSSLSQAVKNYIDFSLRAPLRFVVLTSVDIYNGAANFVFAASWLNGGVLVSTARFGDPVKEQHLVAYRTAKQSLSSILKSFGVPESVDVNSVLSYAQSVEEHDRKGNRPSAEAMAIFRENLRSLDAAWKAYGRLTRARAHLRKVPPTFSIDRFVFLDLNILYLYLRQSSSLNSSFRFFREFLDDL